MFFAHRTPKPDPITLRDNILVKWKLFSLYLRTLPINTFEIILVCNLRQVCNLWQIKGHFGGQN